MVTFWDSSAILPLLAQENESGLRARQLKATTAMTVWWGSSIECHSALRRKQRDGHLDAEGIAAALSRLGLLALAWRVVAPTAAVQERAERLLQAHPLRAADAVQLAAALIACSERTAGSTFHTSDSRLTAAAKSEGFAVT